MNPTTAGSPLDSRSVRVAAVVGILHALVVLGLRSLLSVIATPLLDPYVAWTVVGLTLVGGTAAYVFHAHRLITPPLGLAVSLGWVVLQQWQYRAALGGLAWTTTEPLTYYTTYWPLPLFVVLLLTAVEWTGRRYLSSRTPQLE